MNPGVYGPAVEGLLEARGMGAPALTPVTRIRAAFHGHTARVRPWRGVVEDALDRTEHRAQLMAEAASNARLAGDLDAARSLEELRDNAGSQARWFREFPRWAGGRLGTRRALDVADRRTDSVHAS